MSKRYKTFVSWSCNHCDAVGTTKKELRRCPACGSKNFRQTLEKTVWKNERKN